MPDFFHKPAPDLSPTACVFCFSSEDLDGFLDGGQEIIGYGNVWICATCAKQAGDRFGMLASADAVELREELSILRAEVLRLSAELEAEQDRILVSGAELHKVLLGD